VRGYAYIVETKGEKVIKHNSPHEENILMNAINNALIKIETCYISEGCLGTKEDIIISSVLGSKKGRTQIFFFSKSLFSKILEMQSLYS